MIAHICTRDAGAPRSALRILSAPDIRDAPAQFGTHDLVWVDVIDPLAEDVAWLEQTFGFHQLAR